MAEKSNDPIALWQRMVADMQKGFSALASQAITSSRFGRPVDRGGGEPGSGPPRQLDDLMERYLVSMNLPSRAQMAGLAERLQVIEGQLSEIKALLLQLQANGTASPAVPETPNPPRSRRQPPPAPRAPKPSAEPA